MTPTRITEVVKIVQVYEDGRSYRVKGFKCDDGETYAFNELEGATGISSHTIKTRLSRYGATHPLTLYNGPITNAVLGEFGLLKRMGDSADWDRSKCKRNGELCEDYIECQNKRVGLSSDPWVPPKSTDSCYRELREQRNLFPSAAAMCSAGYLV